MNKPFLNSTILVIAFLACRTDSALKEFYGKYLGNLNSSVTYSELIFYPENRYKFYASSCFGSNKDSGSFIVKKDTIYFTSFDRERDKEIKRTQRKTNRTLTGEKFVLKPNKLIYFMIEVSHRRNHRLGKPYIEPMIFRDTFYWIKDTKKQ